MDGGVWLSWKEIRCCLLLARSPDDLFFLLAILNDLQQGGLGWNGENAGFKGVKKEGGGSPVAGRIGHSVEFVEWSVLTN